MDPPSRPSSLRRNMSAQNLKTTSNTITHDNSPSLSSPHARKMSQAKLRDERVVPADISGLGWNDSDDVVSRSTTRLQVELAECVETKTVTTTTTTKRSYPPLLVRPPRLLHTLDAKEYPLALKPTPYELTNFSYEVNGKIVHFSEDIPGASSSVVNHLPSKSTPKRVHLGQDSAVSRKYETPDHYKPSKPLQRFEDLGVGLNARRLKRPRSPDSLGKQPKASKPHHRVERQSQRRVLAALQGRRAIQDGSNRTDSPTRALLPTPDITEHGSLVNSTGIGLSFTTSSDNSIVSFEEAVSPSMMAAHTAFPSAVATPPIADSDFGRFDEIAQGLNDPAIPRPPYSTTTASNASLPSPSLSPTLAAANLQPTYFQDTDEEDIEKFNSPSITNACDGRIIKQETKTTLERPVQNAPMELEKYQKATVLDTHSMLDTFDSMPDEMKTFMMYQFLRRCPRKTLHTVANVVNPALKCDFLEELPPELSLHILGFLGFRDLCRAAQVSKRWRHIIDSNETGWKELLDRDNFVLPTGELERAIKGGWGWQDPYGSDGWERDLSVGLAPSDGELTTSSGSSSSSSSSKTVNDQAPLRGYSSIKRKRAIGSIGLDRMKRRALSQEPNERQRSTDSRKYGLAAITSTKSEGPNAAATAAALAVPNPHLGLPSLSKLHLFKSIYRRRYMIQHSWMNDTVQPQHLAFPAHPRHVITCLQFDDDKILTGSDDTFIHVYDTRSGKLRKRLEGHEGGVWALQYEGNVLVSGSTDRSVRVWDIEKGLCTQVFHGHTSTVRCLQILMPVDTGKFINGKPVMIPDKPLIITGSRDSQLRVWRLPEQGAKRYIQTGPPANDTDCPYFIRVLTGHTHSVRAIAAHQDTLVSGSYDCSVRVWKISTGETVHALRGHGQKVYSVVLDHVRSRCISGSMDYTVKIWSLKDGANLFTLEGHTSLVGLLDLRDGRLVSAAADWTLRIWDPKNGQCKNTLTAHTSAITCFQHDSTKVISGSDRTLKMWNIQTGECLQDLLTDLSGVWQVKFDDRRCVAAVQRDSLTYIEVLDFGASRDGIPAEDRGRRILLQPSEADRIIEEEEFVV